MNEGKGTPRIGDRSTQADIRLDDGTIVHLFAESAIAHKVQFEDGEESVIVVTSRDQAEALGDGLDEAVIARAQELRATGGRAAQL